MEQCLGDQQFLTLLLYCDDVCSFAPNVSAMFYQIELVFNQLKSSNLKIKPKNFFSGQCDIFGSYLVSKWNVCQPRKD